MQRTFQYRISKKKKSELKIHLKRFKQNQTSKREHLRENIIYKIAYLDTAVIHFIYQVFFQKTALCFIFFITFLYKFQKELLQKPTLALIVPLL